MVPDNQAAGLIHNKLKVDLWRQLSRNDYKSVCLMCRGAYLQPGELEHCDDIMDIMDRLEVKGDIRVGDYTPLIYMLEAIGLAGPIMDMVQRAMQEISELESTQQQTQDSTEADYQPADTSNVQSSNAPATPNQRTDTSNVQSHNAPVIIYNYNVSGDNNTITNYNGPVNKKRRLH